MNNLCADEVACDISRTPGQVAPLPSPVDDYPSITGEFSGSIGTLEQLQQLYGANANEFPRKVIEAGRAGDASTLQSLLADGKRLAELPDFGEGLLHLACVAGDTAIVQALITMRKNHLLEDSGDKSVSIALHKAASCNHSDIVRLLISHSGDVNYMSSDGTTPLHCAAAHDNEDMATALLNAGAAIEVSAEGGHTPLMEAASSGCLGVVKLLLARGANVNTVTTEYRESALTLASYRGHVDVTRVLLDAGADMEHKTDEQQTPLMEAAVDGHTVVARLLLDRGAQVNMSANGYESPLTLAACGGHYEYASLLIERGALLDEVNEEGYTALMEAAREGHLDVVALLIAHGAAVNTQMEDTHETALTLACCGGFLDVVHLLVKSGADLEVGCCTPVMDTSQEGNNLTQAFTGETALTIACRDGFLDIVELLLQAGANMEHETDQKMTPLMKAAHSGHYNIAQLLINRGANVNKCSPNNSHTALSLACAAGHSDVVELLLSCRANPAHKLTDSSTALMEAVKGGHAAVATLLLDYPNIAATTPRAAATPVISPCTSALPVPNQSPAYSEDESNSGNSEQSDKEADIEDEGGGGGTLNLDDDEVAGCFDDIVASLEMQLEKDSVLASERVQCDAPTLMKTAMNRDLLDKLQHMKAYGLELSSKSSALSSLQASIMAASKLDPARTYTEYLRSQEADVQQLLQQQHDAMPIVTTQQLPVSNQSTMSDKMAALSLGQATVVQGEQKASLHLPAAVRSQECAAQPAKIGTAAVSTQTLPLSYTNDCRRAHAIKHMPMQSVPTQVVKCGSETCSGASGSTIDANGHDARMPVKSKKTEVGPALPTAASMPRQPSDCSQCHRHLSAKSSSQAQQDVTRIACAAQHCKNACAHPPLPPAADARHGTSNGATPSTRKISPRPAAAQQPQRKLMLDVNCATESNSDTPLTLASAGGHVDLVQLLLARKADIEHKDKKGFTSLLLAANAGHIGVVKLLLDSGANIEATTERTKDTPLCLACSSSRVEVAEVLIHRGANKEHRNASDYTPLCLAATTGCVDMMKLLLSHGAEINASTWTPEACNHLQRHNHKQRQQKKAPKPAIPGEALCRQSASKLGVSPLMLAAMNGHTAAAKLLVDMGCDVNLQIETNRNTALTLACFQGRQEVVRLLLDCRANVEHRSKTGLTPLMEAASNGFVDVGRVLLEKGADVNAAPAPSSKDTALTIAADKGHNEFVQLLVSKGALCDVKNKKGCSPLWLACNGGHLDVVQSLYGAGADVESCDNRLVSCLMAAFRQGHVKVVKWLTRHVGQLPSDKECQRHLGSAAEKEELLKNCQQCLDVIMAAKERQTAEANKNASILLKEIETEKTRDEKRREAAARKRDKKKQKRKEKVVTDKDSDDQTATDNEEGTELTVKKHIRAVADLKPMKPTATSLLEPSTPPMVPRNKVLDLSTSTAVAPNTSQSGGRGCQPAGLAQQTVNVGVHPPCSPDTNIRPGSQTTAAAAVPSSAASANNSCNDAWSLSMPSRKNKQHSRAQVLPPKVAMLQTNQPPAQRASVNKATAVSPRKGRKDDGWKEVVRNNKKVIVPASVVPLLLSSRALSAIREWSGAGIEALPCDTNNPTERVVMLSGSCKAIRRAHGVFIALIEDPSLALESQLRRRRSRRKQSSTSAGSTALPLLQPLQPQLSPRTHNWDSSSSTQADEDVHMVPAGATAALGTATVSVSGKPTYSTVAAIGIRTITASGSAQQRSSFSSDIGGGSHISVAMQPTGTATSAGTHPLSQRGASAASPSRSSSLCGSPQLSPGTNAQVSYSAELPQEAVPLSSTTRSSETRAAVGGHGIQPVPTKDSLERMDQSPSASAYQRRPPSPAPGDGRDLHAPPGYFGNFGHTVMPSWSPSLQDSLLTNGSTQADASKHLGLAQCNSMPCADPAKAPGFRPPNSSRLLVTTKSTDAAFESIANPPLGSYCSPSDVTGSRFATFRSLNSGQLDQDFFRSAGDVAAASNIGSSPSGREQPSQAVASDSYSSGSQALLSNLNPNASEFKANWSQLGEDCFAKRKFSREQWPLKDTRASTELPYTATGQSLLHSVGTSLAGDMLLLSQNQIDVHAVLHPPLANTFGVIGTERAQKRLAMSRGGSAAEHDPNSDWMQKQSIGGACFQSGSGDCLPPNNSRLPLAPTAAIPSAWSSLPEWWSKVVHVPSPPSTALPLAIGMPTSTSTFHIQTAGAEQPRKVDSFLGTPLRFNSSASVPYTAPAQPYGAAFGSTSEPWNSGPGYLWDRTAPSSSR